MKGVSSETVTGDWRARSAATRRRRSQTKIIDAARALFEARGYDDTTIDAIAERAGVGPATIYEHYGTKDALTGAVFVEKLGDLDGPAAADAAALPVREAVYRHLLRLATVVHKHRPLTTALLSAVNRTDGPPVDPRDPRLIVPLPRPLAVIFTAAAGRGEITVPTTPEDTAASITSWLLLRVKARDETPEQSAEFVTALVLDGLLARSPSS